MATSNRFGPTVPGVIVNRTRVVVAKSWPRTVNDDDVDCTARAVDVAGTNPVRTAVTPRIAATTTTSAVTFLRRPRDVGTRRIAGTNRNRFNAARTTTTATR